MRRIVVVLLIVSLSGCTQWRQRRSDQWYEREQRRDKAVEKTGLVVGGTALVGGLLAALYYGLLKPDDLFKPVPKYKSEYDEKGNLLK